MNEFIHPRLTFKYHYLTLTLSNKSYIQFALYYDNTSNCKLEQKKLGYFNMNEVSQEDL